MKGPNSSSGKTFIAPASVLKRAAAFIMDILIINAVILLPFRKIVEEIVPEESLSDIVDFISNDSGASNSLTFLMFAVAFLSILYFALMEKKLGQSPGKMLFNLYVKSQTKDLKYWQLVARSMFLIPIFPFVLLWIVDPLVMFFNKDSQRLSEILSKTKVFQKYKI